MGKDKKKSKKDEKKRRKKEDKKKRKKKKSLDDEHSNDDGDTSLDIMGEAAASAVPIKLSAGIAPNNVNSSSAVTAGFSWGAAFAAADSIRPNDDELDDDFLQRAAKSDADAKASASTYTSLEKESIKSISQLASSHSNVMEKNVAGRKRKLSESRSSDDDGDGDDDDDAKSNDNNSDSDDESVLEGRTATLTGDDKSIITMVLVDKHGSVYSSGERKSDGKRLQIGQLVGNDIDFDKVAIEEMKRIESGGDTPAAQLFPYDTNEDDHCETPFQAYADIAPLLDALCKSMGKSKSELKIYDPYFCNGSVVNHLSSLGYTNVYNKKEDCYAIWKAQKEPDFDVFITNPPYSSDHIDKLMKYITSTSFGSTPWLLLMPNWVHKKDYYESSTTKNQINPSYPFYIVPKKRYVYVPPPDFREKKASDVHKKSSPFVSMWFVWGGTKNDALIRAFQQSDIVNSCDFARSKSALRDLRRNSGGSNKSSKNKKKKKSK